MPGSLFESLLENSMTLILPEYGDDTAMVVSEEAMYAESGDSGPQYKMQLNDKEVIIEELEDMVCFGKIRSVVELQLDNNDFGDAGVEFLSQAEAISQLTLLSFKGNKLTATSAHHLAVSSK
jgi:hypothetical protein